MRIIAWKTLTKFIASLQGHKDQSAVRGALESWYNEVKAADWNTPDDVRKSHASASFVGKRVVFNIKGNSYRLVAQIEYGFKAVFIIWVGSHRAYDRIDVRTAKYGD